MKYYIFTIIIIICIGTIAITYPPDSDEEKIIRAFYANPELFEKTVECLSASNTDIHLTDSNEVFTEQGINQDLAFYVKECFDSKKAKVISKDAETVYFVCKSSPDVRKGVVYSLDGETPEIQYLTKLVPLETDDWYYYEADFNEWRVINR